MITASTVVMHHSNHTGVVDSNDLRRLHSRSVDDGNDFQGVSDTIIDRPNNGNNAVRSVTAVSSGRVETTDTPHPTAVARPTTQTVVLVPVGSRILADVGKKLIQSAATDDVNRRRRVHHADDGDLEQACRRQHQVYTLSSQLPVARTPIRDAT